MQGSHIEKDVKFSNIKNISCKDRYRYRKDCFCLKHGALPHNHNRVPNTLCVCVCVRTQVRASVCVVLVFWETDPFIKRCQYSENKTKKAIYWRSHINTINCRSEQKIKTKIIIFHGKPNYSVWVVSASSVLTYQYVYCVRMLFYLFSCLLWLMLKEQANSSYVQSQMYYLADAVLHSSQLLITHPLEPKL